MAWFGKSAKSLNDSGTTYALKGQYDRAIAYFDEAVKLDRGEVHHGRQFPELAAGDFLAAIRAIGKRRIIP